MNTQSNSKIYDLSRKKVFIGALLISSIAFATKTVFTAIFAPPDSDATMRHMQVIAHLGITNIGLALGDKLVVNWFPGPAPPTHTTTYKRVDSSITIDETEHKKADGPDVSGGGMGTPLLLDLARNGFHLGKTGDGVYFDITNEDKNIRYQWVKRNTDDAFLVIDLNGNGIIDDGSELFGEGTSFVGSDASANNGFQALTQYDHQEAGGNEDGRISNKDDVWESLGLWIDKNANGVSDSGELYTLNEFNITDLDINYVESIKSQKGKTGNEIPYWSWVKGGLNGPGYLVMADVFFAAI